MIPSHSFVTAFGPEVGNHLWQSTAVAAVSGLIALALRRNRARARYWLWMAASIKFLVPFLLLAAFGNQLGAWLTTTAPAAQLPVVMQELARPFEPADLALATAAPAARSISASRWPVFLLAVWSLGFAIVFLNWFNRWRKVAAAVRRSQPITGGREAEAFQRLQSAIRGPRLRLVSAATRLEPGVFGVIRPVLWLPAGIADRLSENELDAIMTHELCHARHRDNLAAVVHMLVEAIFWFHPLVWWLGARLTEERERACDEEVVRMGADPQAYAEGILRVCEFYLTSPVLCAAGVTGADLKRRIETIMANAFTRKLSRGRKALLALAAALAVAGPIAVGLVTPPRSRAQSSASEIRFEVASVRPAGTMTQFKCLPGSDSTTPVRLSRCETLRVLMMQAYNLRDFQISGPEWIDSDLFSIQATTRTPASKEAMMQMLGKLLGDRLQLRFHREPRDFPVYALVTDKGGPKFGPNFHASKEGDPLPSGGDFRWRISMQDFAHAVAMYLKYPLPNPGGSVDEHLGLPVIDGTGLSGNYDIVMTLEPGHNWFAMLRSQLGLRLESRKAPLERIIIDHAERTPTEN